MADETITLTQAELDAKIAAAVAPLKTKQTELMDEAKNAKRALAAYEGIDPVKAKQLQKAADDAEAAAAAARGDFTARERQLTEAHKRELEERDGKIGKYRRVVEKRTAEAQVRSAIKAANGDEELLLPHMLPFVQVQETDDDFTAVLVEGGTPLVADGQGTPLSFDAFVESRLKPKFPDAFKGTGSSGGGASKSVAGGAGVRVIPESAAWTKADIADVAAGKAVVK